MDLKDLTRAPLTGFTVEEYTEVFRVNEDGLKTKTIGFLKDNTIAVAWKDMQTNPAWCKTAKGYVLTNGKIGFLIEAYGEILNDEQAAIEVRENALNKLSEEEKKILGL